MHQVKFSYLKTILSIHVQGTSSELLVMVKEESSEDIQCVSILF